MSVLALVVPHCPASCLPDRQQSGSAWDTAHLRKYQCSPFQELCVTPLLSMLGPNFQCSFIHGAWWIDNFRENNSLSLKYSLALYPPEFHWDMARNPLLWSILSSSNTNGLPKRPHQILKASNLLISFVIIVLVNQTHHVKLSCSILKVSLSNLIWGFSFPWLVTWCQLQAGNIKWKVSEIINKFQAVHPSE